MMRRILYSVASGVAWGLLVFVLAGVSGCTTANPRGHVSPPRIAMVGDSWPLVMILHRSFQSAYVAEGYEKRQVRDVAVGWELYHMKRWGHTAYAGIEAYKYNTEHYLEKLKRYLEKYATIEVVHLTLGGADLLHGYRAGTPLAETDARLRDEIMPEVAGVIEFIRREFPDIRIGFAGYDYLNYREFIHTHPRTNERWNELGRPDPREMNEIILLINNRQKELVARYPGVVFIDSLGHTKRRFGMPDDMDEPNPQAGLWKDGGHLNREGNLDLAQRALDLAYRDWIGPLRNALGIRIRREGLSDPGARAETNFGPRSVVYTND